ncbi:hypothetical protein NU195Hw_g2998t1 [Hortaea werneckii]
MRAQSAGLPANFNQLFFGTPDWPSVKLRAASTVVLFFSAAHRTSYDLQSTASVHAHYILFKLYPAPWTTFNVSVTNFLHPTVVIWAVHFLVDHWTINFSSASSLYYINFFIVYWTANFSSASTLYRVNFFIVYWAANFSSASSLYHINFFIVYWAANFSSASAIYRINFFILHWTANFSSASTLYRNNIFILHWTANPPSSANGPAFLVNRASNRPTFILPSWIMPSVVLPYRPTDYCDYCHLQHDWVPQPVWILYTLAPTVRYTSTHYSHRNTVLSFANKHLSHSRRSDLSKRANILPDGGRDGNAEIHQLGIVNGTTPADGQCVRFSKAVSSVIYFLTGPQLPDDCRIGYYDTYDCTDGAFRTVGLVERAEACSSPGRKTRSLKISCDGGPGPHY